MTYSFLSIRVNVSHLCRRRLTYKFAGMYPIIVIALNDIVKIFPNHILIPFSFFFFMCLFVVFIITTINQIKEHLHIRAFHVPHREE